MTTDEIFRAITDHSLTFTASKYEYSSEYTIGIRKEVDGAIISVSISHDIFAYGVMMAWDKFQRMVGRGAPEFQPKQLPSPVPYTHVDDEIPY
jgi:hypothetical protein